MLRLMVSGVNCETDINECNYDPPICKNGGVCTNLPGRHSCSCTTQTEAGELITGRAMVSDFFLCLAVPCAFVLPSCVPVHKQLPNLIII